MFGVKGMIEALGQKLIEIIELIGEYTNKILNSVEKKYKEKTNAHGKRIDSLIFQKMAGFFNPSGFNIAKLLSLIFPLYVLGAVSSFVPILYPQYWLFGIGLIFLGVLSIWAGASLPIFGAKKQKISYNFLAGVFVLGLIGLLANFLSTGVPLFSPQQRLGYHNLMWSLSMGLYVIGMTMTFLKHMNKQSFLVFGAISLVLSILSGFRTDLILFISPLLFFAYLKKSVARTDFFVLLFIFLILFVGIKYALLASGGGSGAGEYELISRPGFTLYVLSVLTKNVGPFGLTHGRLFLGNQVLQLFNIPVQFFGSVVAEMVINMPRSHASMLVGPLYLEFGLPGVIVGCFIIGFFCELPHKMYKLTKHIPFLALYTINLSILLVWIETGPVQYYLVFLFFGLGIWCLSQCLRKRGK